MLRILLILYSCCILQASVAQTKFDHTWVTGFQYIYSLDFNSLPPATAWVDTQLNGFARVSCISDSNGSLLFSSNGCMVFDKNMNIMEGGDTISGKAYHEYYFGFSLAPQSSIILPMSNGKYYLFTTTPSDSDFITNWWSGTRAAIDEIRLSEVDMQANGGLGKVVRHEVFYKDTTVRGLSKCQMTACRHANGKDWWLIKQGQIENRIVVFFVSADTAYLASDAIYPSVLNTFVDIDGQATFSQDGSKLAIANVWETQSRFFLADFDRCTGLIGQHKGIRIPDTASTYGKIIGLDIDTLYNGIAFSPSGRFIYVALDCNIYQFDTQDSTWYHVAGMDTTVLEFNLYSNMLLGPDGKLYVGNRSNFTNAFNVIEHPDVKGAGCGWCRRCVRFPNTGVSSIPTMPNYDLGAETCWPVSTPELGEMKEEIMICPNPSSSKFYIKNAKPHCKKELYNSIGQRLLATKENEIDVSRLAKGVYYLRCAEQSVKVVVE